MTEKLAHREIVYDGKSSIRTAYNNLGTRMDDVTQYGYERYHTHEEYQLMYLEEGKAAVTVEDIAHVYSQGDILLLGAKLPHKIEACEGFTCKGILIQFRQSLFPTEMQSLGDYRFVHALLIKSIGGLLFHANENIVTPTWRNRLPNLFFAIHGAKGIRRLCLLLDLLDGLGRKLKTGAPISRLSTSPERENLGVVVEKCKRYLRTHYKDYITLPALCQTLGANDTALCRKFKEETGETIFQHLTHLRIEAACKMLRNTKRSVSETAFLCGFNTVTHFNRKFKEIMNVPPSIFRGEE